MSAESQLGSMTFYGRVYDRVRNLSDEFRHLGFETSRSKIRELLSFWVEFEMDEPVDPGFLEIQRDFPAETEAASSQLPELLALEGLVDKAVALAFPVEVV